jgi:hypothetical protein
VFDEDVPGCAGVIDTLAPRASGTTSCSREATLADVGTVEHTASAESDQTPLSTSTLGVVVNRFQPDARINVGTGPLAGDGVYNTTGTGQSRSVRVGPGGTARFRVTIQNDGTAADTFRLSGPGSTNRFAVTYTFGTTNITPGVVAGTRRIAAVPGGQLRTVVVTVKARPGTPPGGVVTRKLTVVSQLSGRRDAVKMTVTRR